MKIYRIIVLLFISIFFTKISYSQNDNLLNDTINQVDNSGLKQGIWREYHSNGQLEYETFYLNDTIEGNYTSYYDNGQLECKYFISNQKKEGDYILYQENGVLKGEISYKNGKRVFFRKYNPKGELHYEELYDKKGIIKEQNTYTTWD